MINCTFRNLSYYRVIFYHFFFLKMKFNKKAIIFLEEEIFFYSRLGHYNVLFHFSNHASCLFVFKKILNKKSLLILFPSYQFLNQRAVRQLSIRSYLLTLEVVVFEPYPISLRFFGTSLTPMLRC